MESALTTIPPNSPASAIASADLPLHVGPAMISASTSMRPVTTGINPPQASRLPWAASPAMPRGMHVLTLIAPPGTLSADLIARVAKAVGGTPTMLSDHEAAAISIDAPPDPVRLQDAIGAAPIDTAVTPAVNRRKRLLIADMDSTIVTSETLDELAGHAGLQDQVAAITRRSMNGEVEFTAALRERVGLLRGLPLDALAQTWNRTRVTDGAAELVATMRAHGATAALVSGGFTYFTGRVAAQLGFDTHRANTLLDDGAALTGQVGEPILDRASKLEILTSLAAAGGLGLDDCLAVGDGANDLAMIAAAGLGVAFHAKPVVATAARVRIQHCGLRALLFMQGYSAAEIVPG
ncbi:MAG: phosphoserine phosphatase SerB [Gemmatimonadaceae bacterium]|nr:phosphoserine phosphatase SerB [Acetobacteraceae bacterium]